jgi:hypothetical protein
MTTLADDGTDGGSASPNGDKPTIYDVADRDGVAISTVSRVLNGSD